MLEPTQQIKAEFIMFFSSNRKKVNSFFFPFMATLKKKHSTGIFS